jgi:hypothetical protein
VFGIGLDVVGCESTGNGTKHRLAGINYSVDRPTTPSKVRHGRWMATVW